MLYVWLFGSDIMGLDSHFGVKTDTTWLIYYLVLTPLVDAFS